MSFLQNLNRETYDFTRTFAVYDDKGKEVSPARVLRIPGSDERSRKTVSAFVPLMDDADSIDCIVDASLNDSCFLVEMTNVTTERSAILKLTYSGEAYSAKVLLGSEQLSVKSGVSNAQQDIRNYLNAVPEEKRKTRSIKIVEAVDSEEDKYGHLESQFE